VDFPATTYTTSRGYRIPMAIATAEYQAGATNTFDD